MGYNICVLNLAEKGLTDDRLALAMTSVPPNSIVLLEDIDAAFPSRPSPVSAEKGQSLKNRNMHTGSDVTFSGLLNVLDGVASSEERLVFMTTNFMEHLDSALIRPGRVDIVEYIGDASLSQVYKMFLKFYPDTVDASTGRSSFGESFAEAVMSSMRPMRFLSVNFPFFVNDLYL